jgi:hypothetical protein
MASSNNDINVLNMSPFTHHVAKDDIHFVINYMNLFLGIICLLIASKSKVVFLCKQFMTLMMKNANISLWCKRDFKKHVEWAFGVIQFLWAIISNPFGQMGFEYYDKHYVCLCHPS